MKLYGYKALKENLENVESVILTNNKNEAIELLKKNKIPYTIKPVSYFNTNFKNINHQFIVSTAKSKTSLNFDDYINSLSKKDKAIVVILDSILDPHNFGAILRTCEAFNVDAVIYKKDNQAQITDTVSKISQGAVNRLNMFKTTNLINSIETLKKNKF
jgi:23S rRNA (guanosine2251-2'-O)-methyltransferase